MGRDTERGEVTALLADTRLVTLTGAGGSGKTRLAREVAAEVAPRFADGACWVDLAGLRDPRMVPAALAVATGVHERPAQDLVETLGERLRGVQLLVVLDNCEHQIGACASLVSGLLRACPDVAVLATSREPLACAGEATYVVPPLALPEPAATTAPTVAAADAARLFELRAGQVRPGYRITDDDAAAVAEVCRRLDGLPLAIELAAARSRVLAPAQIAEGLSDRFALLTGGGRDALPRQRTLEASVAWSEELLDATERLTLARLSVFASDFDLEAAEAVAAGGDIEHGRVLDLLSGLVDRSLVQVSIHEGRARYRLLETIRAYARQRLVAIDDPARLRDRHLGFHVALAARAQAALAGPDPGPWLSRLSAGLDDLRAAMDWAVASERPTAVLAIAEPTFDFWMVRGLYVEMHRRLVTAVASSAASEADRARGLTTASILALMGGDHTAGHALASEAVPLARRLGDGTTLARTLAYRAWCGLLSGRGAAEAIRADSAEAVTVAAGLDDDPETRLGAMMFAGTIEASLGPFAEGRAKLEQTVAAMEAEGLTYLLVIARAFLADVLVVPGGDLEAARARARQALEGGRAIGLQSFVALALWVLGSADMLEGAETGARRHLAEALAVARHGGLPTDELVAQGRLAKAEYRFGTPARARAAAEEWRRAARSLGSGLEEADAEWLLGALALRDGRAAEAAHHLERARELAIGPGIPGTLGRALLGLAHVRRLSGDLEDAWQLAHEGLGTLADAGDVVGTVDAVETVAGLDAALGRPQRALRLLGAADRVRARTAIGRFPVEAQSHERCLADAGEQLVAEEAARCRTAGGALSLEEAVAYARRGRGARGRPRSGWPALTPAEREVVRLVAQGRSNTEISEQLFVSVNTVKKHLSHVYDKVDVGGRAELVAEAAHRVL